MTLSLEEYLGAKPFLYARDLLKRMGVSGYYVNEYEVLDFLGYEVKEFDFNLIPPKIIEQEKLKGLDAILFFKENKVYVRSHLSKTRKRLTLFHEGGHEVIPFHRESTHAIKRSAAHQLFRKYAEKEAFLAGAEMMFPLKPFVDDSMSLPLALPSIKKLAMRYRGSLEATALRYAMTNQEVMAILVVRKNEIGDKVGDEEDSSPTNPSNQSYLFEMPYAEIASSENIPPLRIHYFCSSYRFPKFIRAGKYIKPENIIYDAWTSQRFIEGEISASLFHNTNSFAYNAQCMPLQDGRIIVLLWLPKEQIEYIKGPIE